MSILKSEKNHGNRKNKPLTAILNLMAQKAVLYAIIRAD